MSGVLRLESLTKGNTLKQGDKTPLKYRLFDADGEKLNVAGKPAKVRLVYPDFLTIGYEKDGLTVAQDDTVTFTIDKVIPSRIYHIEIIVDDKFIFPSRADESKFTVDKSSLGTDSSVIEIVGVDAVVRKAVDLINKDPNLIIDEDKLVNGIIENSGIGSIGEYQQQFDDIIKELSEEKDYYSLPEIAGARGGFDTLGERLNDTTAQLTDTVKRNDTGVLNFNVFDEPTRATLQGLAPSEINAVLGESNVLEHNIADGQVTNKKAKFSGVNMPETFTFAKRGQSDFLHGSNTARIYSKNELLMKKGDIIALDNAELYDFSIFSPDGSAITGWRIAPYTFEEDRAVFLSLRHKDDSVIETSDIENMGKSVYRLTPETVTNSEVIDSLLLKNKNEILDVISRGVKQIGELSVIRPEPQARYSLGRLYSKLIKFKAGDKISLLSGANFDYAVFRDSNQSVVKGWNTGDYTFSTDVAGYLALRKSSGKFVESDAIEAVKYIELLKGSGIKYNTTYYVSPNGSDSNEGTRDRPFATFNKAISEGAEEIYAERGIYRNQTINKNTGKLKIKPYSQNESWDTSRPDRSMIVIHNGDFIENISGTETIKELDYVGNSQYQEVFINNSLEYIVGTGYRASYSAVLWQNHSDWKLDKRLKPVATVAEVESEIGTFHWDGSKVIINPFDTREDIIGYTAEKGVAHGITLSNLQELYMEDVMCMYSRGRNFRLIKNNNFELVNCESRYTSTSDGFQLDYSTGILRFCRGNKSKNDGFNMHYYGHTDFYDCEGHYNSDDGISHHDGCTGNIHGGEWSHNYKGGIASPTYGSIVNIHGSYCHNNGFGLYAEAGVDYEERSIRVFDNVFKNNGTDMRIGVGYTVLGKGNVFDTMQGEQYYTNLDGSY